MSFLISARVKNKKLIDIFNNEIIYMGTPATGGSIISGSKGSIYTDSSRYFEIKIPKTLSGDFTIYFWCYCINNIDNRWSSIIITCPKNFNPDSNYAIFASTNGDIVRTDYLQLVIDGKNINNLNFYSTNSTWTNYCLTRKDGITNFYINGIKRCSIKFKNNIQKGSYIGFSYVNYFDSVHRWVSAYYDDIVVADQCLFDGNFTPPTNHYLFPDVYKVFDDKGNLYGKEKEEDE